MDESGPSFHFRGIAHYYGDFVRRILLFAGIVILVALPFYHELVPGLSSTSLIIFALLLILFAAAMSPRKPNVAKAASVISGCGVLLFEYAAISQSFEDLTLTSIRQLLAIAFAVTLYFSIKTVRGIALAAGHSE